MQQEQNGLLQELYEGYQGALRFVARKSGIPYEEIDDIIQDTFYSFIRAGPTETGFRNGMMHREKVY